MEARHRSRKALYQGAVEVRDHQSPSIIFVSFFAGCSLRFLFSYTFENYLAFFTKILNLFELCFRIQILQREFQLHTLILLLGIQGGIKITLLKSRLYDLKFVRFTVPLRMIVS